MKIELTKKEKKRLVSLALASVLTTGIPTMANAEVGNVTAPLSEETQVDYTEYSVMEGDTLGKIAEKFFGNAGYWEQLAEYNKLKEPNKLFVGEVIRIPNNLAPLVNNDTVYVEYVAPVTYPEDETYVVESGDMMTCIVSKFYDRIDLITVDKLATYNNLSDPNKIYVDQVLLIPCIEKLDKVIDTVQNGINNVDDYSVESICNR